jgi:hypothetical protein
VYATELYKKFTEFEKKYKLLSSENSYNFIWERMRFGVFYSLQKEYFEFGQAHTAVRIKDISLKKKINILCRLLFNSIIKSPFFFSNKYQYIFWSGGRRMWDSNIKAYYSIPVDPLVDYLSLNKTLFIEEPVLYEHYTPAYTKNICYTDFFLLLGFLRKILKNKKAEKIIFDYFKQIEMCFNSYFQRSIVFAKNAILIYRSYKAYVPIFNLFFKLHHPKVLFIVCSYGEEDVIEAAKKNNIPVVEIQHGLIAKGDTAGYDIPDGCIKKSFPDYFLSFGEYWIEDINFPIPAQNIFNVGFPYLTEQSKYYKNVHKKDQIVFISQGIYGKKLSRFAIELCEKVSHSILIIFKLHPGEWARWKDEYPELAFYNKKNKIKVIDNSEIIHNYQLLAESKWICGINSTLIYESLFFFCKIFILNFPGCFVMKSLIEDGIAFLVSTPDEIDLTYNCESDDKMYSNLDYYFASNWEENINIVLERINVTIQSAFNKKSKK